jgi:hypothetical protein
MITVGIVVAIGTSGNVVLMHVLIATVILVLFEKILYWILLQTQASYCQGRGGRQKWLGISRRKISNQGDIH